ncbi:MAG: class I tRNA ligase family protein [Coriobacteriales bacterium]|jgi:methionyl-tRNA synthetase|nr:class I tRNA ligase family protein [Coriobacteriales bacterium]
MHPKSSRPNFPKRAIVTAGMPYGNKGLHFGHIGGVFVPADCYARFLRDRIGQANVLFVCGTDCYGSPIDEGFRKSNQNGQSYDSIEAYVLANHKSQTQTLISYGISLDIFEGSGLGESKDVHQRVTAEIIQRLYANGYLHQLSTNQFYDDLAASFLNGRQVVGNCPVPGCKSEHGYADECDLGHQYLPSDLLNPKSTLTGETPVMREVKNWYFDLPMFRDLLQDHVRNLNNHEDTRPVVANTIDEFLALPSVYIKQEFEQDYLNLQSQLPKHEYIAVEKGRHSFELQFFCLKDRDAARNILDAAQIRYRAGKTLVPFRITGNIKWGVSAPRLADANANAINKGISTSTDTVANTKEVACVDTTINAKTDVGANEQTSANDNLSVWCWPESLWAPISFTRTILESSKEKPVQSLHKKEQDSNTAPSSLNWQDWWCSKDSQIYQFIGQDNIYFYGIAQTAMWAATASPNDHAPSATALPGELQQSTLIANYHLQFLGKKASSSGQIKPPMADDLLNYYTAEQLRAHFLALGLGLKPVSFQPKPLNPNANSSDADPVLKEGQLLTNIFNRLARSCFYAAEKDNGCLLPLGEVSPELRAEAKDTILAYEYAMYKTELHQVMKIAGDFVRFANKYWSDEIKAVAQDDINTRILVLKNTFYLLRVCCILMHPIVPDGTELIVSKMDFKYKALSEFFSWEHVFSGYEPFVSNDEIKAGGHPINGLPPRFDFFCKHESQLKD